MAEGEGERRRRRGLSKQTSSHGSERQAGRQAVSSSEGKEQGKAVQCRRQAERQAEFRVRSMAAAGVRGSHEVGKRGREGEGGGVGAGFFLKAGGAASYRGESGDTFHFSGLPCPAHSDALLCLCLPRAAGLARPRVDRAPWPPRELLKRSQRGLARRGGLRCCFLRLLLLTMPTLRALAARACVRACVWVRAPAYQRPLAAERLQWRERLAGCWRRACCC